jgi:hypothetical protein
MVLKPRRPTLAKTALEWGTLKFRSRPHAALGDRLAAFATSETPVDFKGFSKVSQGSTATGCTGLNNL